MLRKILHYFDSYVILRKFIEKNLIRTQFAAFHSSLTSTEILDAMAGRLDPHEPQGPWCVGASSQTDRTLTRFPEGLDTST